MSKRVEEIRRRLAEAFEPIVLDVHDDSLRHAGHRGVAESGGGHFYATIVSSAFEGKTLVRRHQAVYEALGEMMRADVHALGIKAFTPSEYQLPTHQEQE